MRRERPSGLNNLRESSVRDKRPDRMDGPTRGRMRWAVTERSEGRGIGWRRAILRKGRDSGLARYGCDKTREYVEGKRMAGPSEETL